MIPVSQTKRGGPDVPPEERGDCFDACLASVLEVGIEETYVPHVEEWWTAAQETAERHGHRIVYYALPHSHSGREIGEWLGPIYWLAGIPSLNLGLDANGEPVMHVVVMRGTELAHDPSLGERHPLGEVGEDFRVNDVMFLVPLEPRSTLAAAA